MNADPRRPDKVQRYAPTKNNANGEDLTPDYMNIMGQPATTANAAGESVERHPETNVVDHIHHARPDDVQQASDGELTASTNAANVIPTSPQYGVAIIPNNINLAANDLGTTESVALTTDSLADSTAKTGEDFSKDLHSTPSKNERFKVVKIASLEPFKRGRWKCMDYVDEAPPPNVVNAATKIAQSVGNANNIPGAVYLQTQSLPQQQIQQMLLQGGFTNGTQFFGPNVPTQIIPQGQYFYPQVANVQSQTVSQPVATSMPAQFINNQPYFAAGVVAANPAGFTLPQSYANIQYVPIPAQGTAFVPTSQAMHLPASFQQSQSYSGQPTSVSQANITQNMVNGHGFPQQQQQQQQQNEVQGPGMSLPNQPVKNVIVVNSQPATNSNQSQAGHVIQNPAQSAPIVPSHQFQQPHSGSFQPPAQSQNNNQTNQNVQATAPTMIAPVIGVTQQPQQNFDPSNVYTNPQFAMSVNSLTVLDASQDNQEVKEANSATETTSDSAEDPNKSNPVVNAIDNKIEQAMDLVKSHLMYTVREEVEVLKEKIAELMERIQQLETENNYLRSLIPKNVAAPPPTSTTFGQPAAQPQNIAVVNPTPNVIPQNSNPMINSNPPTIQPVVQSNPPTVVQNNPPSQNQTIPNSTHQTSKEATSGVQ